MNLKEYAEENDLTMTEAKAKTGLTHWKQEVVAKAPEPSVQHDSNGVADISYHSHPQVAEVETFVEEVVIPVVEKIQKPSDIIKESQAVMKMLMKDGIDAGMALVGIKMIGKKSSYFQYATILKTLTD